MGYTVAAVPGHDHNCDYNDGVRPPGPVHLEPVDQLQVMFRIEGNRVTRSARSRAIASLMRMAFRCAGFAMCVPPKAWHFSESFVTSDTERRREGAVAAIALHADPAADEVLERIAAPNQPESLREKAVFWMGEARGSAGMKTCGASSNEDASTNVRDKAIFALSISKDPRAVDTMIEVAHRDTSSHVRGQALFWLAQKAGKKAVGAISGAIENDPDTEVKKKAVFACSNCLTARACPC